MEQTENEFGIRPKKPEVKNGDQEATGQPASNEQPKTDEEEKISEDAKEMLTECEKKQRRQYLLEKLWICVVVMIAASMTGWLVIGKWLYAVNNLLWLFIAWMYWRQQKAVFSAGEFILHLLRKIFILTKQVDSYEKLVNTYSEKDEIWKKIDTNNTKMIANYEKRIAKLEKLVEHLKKED